MPRPRAGRVGLTQHLQPGDRSMTHPGSVGTLALVPGARSSPRSWLLPSRGYRAGHQSSPTPRDSTPPGSAPPTRPPFGSRWRTPPRASSRPARASSSSPPGEASLNISVYGLFRWIDQTPGDQTFTDHLGRTRDVAARERHVLAAVDDLVHRILRHSRPALQPHGLVARGHAADAGVRQPPVPGEPGPDARRSAWPRTSPCARCRAPGPSGPAATGR